MTGRAVLAVVMMGGFYLLVAVVALGLIAAPVLQWIFVGGFDVRLLLAVAVGAGLLWLLVPRREPFTPPGPPVGRDAQPELWSLIEKICSVIHHKVPADIYLLDEMNAYVADVRGFLGFGGRRVMGLGVPLMRVLDPEEFGAVVAHEFGHFHSGGTRFGPLIHRTRSAMSRTLVASEGSLAHLVFTKYAELYLRLTEPVSRAQELTADALAASATSPRAMAGALARLPFGTVAFDVYLRTEYVPVLESGHQPPFLEGFDAFLTSTVAQEHLRLQADAAFGSTTRSRYDSHPPVPERLHALGVDVADYRDRPLPEVSAVALLRDVGGVETQLAARQLRDGAPLTPIAWSEVGRMVLAPAWTRERASLIGDLPPGFHLGALPIDRDGLAELGEDVGRSLGRSLSRPELEAYGHHVARAIIGEAAVRSGLPVEMVPGEPVWFGRAPDQLGLFSAYDDVVEGRVEPYVWFDVLREAGLLESAVPGRPPVEPVAPPPPPAPARPDTSPLAPAPPSSAPPAPTPVVMTPPVVTPPVVTPPLMTPPVAAPAPAMAPLPIAAESPSRRPAMPRPAGPSNERNRQDFDVPIGMGRRQRLLIDGDTVTWRGTTVSADEVTGLAYSSGDVLEVHLWTADSDLQVKMTANGRNRETSVPAWQALVRWTEALVEGRLVDTYLARLAEAGRVTVGDLVVTTKGVSVKGRVVPWSVLAEVEFDGRSVTVAQRADNAEGRTELARVDATIADVVLIPTLVAAASAAATDASG